MLDSRFFSKLVMDSVVWGSLFLVTQEFYLLRRPNEPKALVTFSVDSRLLGAYFRLRFCV